jgi:hypothetical protein
MMQFAAAHKQFQPSDSIGIAILSSCLNLQQQRPENDDAQLMTLPTSSPCPPPPRTGTDINNARLLLYWSQYTQNINNRKRIKHADAGVDAGRILSSTRKTFGRIKF